LRVQGAGCRVHGVRFMVQGCVVLGHRAKPETRPASRKPDTTQEDWGGGGLRIWGLEFRVWGSGFGVQGERLWVYGPRFRVQSVWSRVQASVAT